MERVMMQLVDLVLTAQEWSDVKVMELEKCMNFEEHMM